MNNLVALKTENDDFRVEYEIISPIDISSITNQTRREITLALQDVDKQIDLCEDEIAKLSAEIDKFTNHADGIDYAIAVASGILTGVIDSFFVGKLNLKECYEFGSKKIDSVAKKFGNNEDLQKAIRNLENKTKKFFPSDSNINDFGGARQHHLRDFAHHPTIVGLVCSLLTQFTEMCYGTDTKGTFLVVPVKDKERIGDTLPKKIVYGTLYWFLHLVSDMAGSNQHAGGGTGLPGPLLSLVKELSALPFFKKINKDGNKEISVFISKLFNGTLFAERDNAGKIIKETIVPIDLRTEIGVFHKQALPVIINEFIVRSFYSIRRFGIELKKHPVTEFRDLKQLDWKIIIPLGNRTVERMMTIASGTFAAVDIADAAIRSGGFNAACLLRVNFVGVGRFAIAVGVDVGMGIKRSKLRNERIDTYNQMLALSGAKVYYLEAGMWCSATDTGKTLEKTMEIAENSVAYFAESWQNIEDNMQIIGEEVADIVDSDSDFAQEILDELDY